jgi:hypothetical protein
MASRKWPLVKNRIGYLARADIKRISPGEIERLAEAARSRHWSARGRPAWLKAHRDDIENCYLTFLNEETGGCLRCSVAVVLSDGSGRHFSLDVAPEDFERLKDADPETLIRMAHLYLNSFKHVPLDPDQMKTWDRPG